MGACEDLRPVKASTVTALRAHYENIVAECLHEYGHGGYTGTFAESPDLSIGDFDASDEAEAEQYILDNARKWENTLAVRIGDTDTWILGGIFSS